MGSRDTPIDAWPWKVDKLPERTGTLVVSVFPTSTTQETPATPAEGLDAPSSDASQFLLENARQGHHLVKFLLPALSGYVVQSDFFERRMVDCLDVIKTKGFLAPAQHVDGFTTEQCKSIGLSKLLRQCYGAVVVHCENSSSVAAASVRIDEELVKRLSFSWLSPNPIARKRLAIVGAGSFTKLEGFALAAISLNVALVVFDEPGEFISSDKYAYLREEFVPFDMSVGTDMPHRIAAAVSEYQSKNTEDKRLDGIMTLNEHLLTIMSQAAELLKFPTSPAKSVGLAQNKFQTRQLDTNVYCRLVRSKDDLEKLLSEDGSGLVYPLIVKPSKGWSSEGVWRVQNEAELRSKVTSLWQDGLTAWHGCDVVIETYIDGPEVDANIVLVDGEVVFFEVSDDFPSPGDSNYDDDRDKNSPSAPVPNFVETFNVLPSALPSSELQALQQRLHELSLAAGFRDGVLHLEARLRNSSCHYTKGPDSEGLVDLRPNAQTKTTTKPQDVFLLEINPRPPGWQVIEATAHAYGVSYYSLSVLHAIGDRNRTVALSRPFEGGSQYHMQLLYVPAYKGGIYRYGDACGAVLSASSPRGRRLASHVVKGANLMEDGQSVPDPRTGQVYGNFIAFFWVVSHTSRLEAMQIGHEIEHLVRVHTDGF